MLDWLSELAHLGLLEKVWPSERVVLGRRVCTWLRVEMQVQRKVLLSSSCRCAGSKVEEFRETVTSFSGKEIRLRWIDQGRVSTHALLQAVTDAVCEQQQSAATIKHLDLGLNNLEKRGAEGLAQVLGSQPTIESLGLSGNCFSHMEASVLGQALRLGTCRGLTHLDLSCNQLGERGAAYLAPSLKLCTALQHLDLTSNRIGTAGVELLVSGLVGCKFFAHLGLADNNILGPGANMLSTVLRECTAFRYLDLSRNPTQTAERLFVAVGQSVSLSHLDLHSNHIGDDGAACLADVLGESTSLSYLDLNDCSIGDGGLRNIASVLAVTRSLAHLDLGRNDFGTLGCHILASQVAACSQLAFLGLDAISDVTGSRVASDAIGALASGLTNCPHLTHLALSRIELGAQGATRLAEWLDRLHVSTLDLAGNQIQDAGMTALSEPLRRQQARALTQLDLRCNRISASGAAQLALSLRACTALRVLRLSGNTELEDAGARALAEGVSELQSLQSLDLAATSLSVEGVVHVTASLSRCPDLAELDLHENQVGGFKSGTRRGPPGEARADHDATGKRAGVHGGGAPSRPPRWVCDQIQRLDLSRNACGLDLDVCAVLGEMLGRCWRLTRLDLVANDIEAAGCGSLARGLADCIALQHLELCGNDVGDVGASLLSEALPRCSSLAFLGLSGNEIRDAGARALCEGLAGCVSLAHVELAHNRISTQGCWRLARMLFKHKPLARLDLSHNAEQSDTSRIWADVQQQGLFPDPKDSRGASRLRT